MYYGRWGSLHLVNEQIKIDKSVRTIIQTIIERTSNLNASRSLEFLTFQNNSFLQSSPYSVQGLCVCVFSKVVVCLTTPCHHIISGTPETLIKGSLYGDQIPITHPSVIFSLCPSFSVLLWKYEWWLVRGLHTETYKTGPLSSCPSSRRVATKGSLSLWGWAERFHKVTCHYNIGW